MCPPLRFPPFAENTRLRNIADKFGPLAGPPMRKWDQDAVAVKVVQRALNVVRRPGRSAGYAMPESFNAAGLPDGIYGDEMVLTVKLFQEEHAFPVEDRDGVVGAKTLCKLDEMLAVTPIPIFSDAEDVPGSSTPFLVGSKGGVGREPGNHFDFTFSDVPTTRQISPERMRALAQHLQASDPNLEFAIKLGFGTEAQIEGLQAVDRFCDGTGRAIVHPTGGRISNLVLRAPEFQPLLRITRETIDMQVRQQGTRGGIDYRTFRIVPGLIPEIAFESDDALFVLIHGVQEVKVFIKDFTVQRTTKTYNAMLRFELCDHFGFGDNDFHTNPVAGSAVEGAVRGAWVLQHDSSDHSRDGFIRGRHRPFVMRVIVETPLSGRF